MAESEKTGLALHRAEINEIDAQMAKLFTRRMEAASHIAEYKREHGLPITDRAREEALLSRCAALVNDELRAYYMDFLRAEIEISKRYQKRITEGMRIAFAGIEGAFSHLAARRIFPSGQTVACADFGAAYRSVVSGECDCAVLPIENSFAGDVNSVVDLAYEGDLSVSGVFDLPVVQSLLVKPGTRMEDITEVVSHPQALSQCSEYLERHGWTRTEAVNTAVAAQTVSGSDRLDIAVVAGEEAAARYGLSVLRHGINTQKNNTTRFAVFTKTPCTAAAGDAHFILFFTVRDAPGALGQAVECIGRSGYNLQSLKSRPTGNQNWEYYFYAEGEGCLAQEAGRKMLADLAACCSRVKLLGSCPAPVLLEAQEG